MGWLWGEQERLLTSLEEGLIRKVFTTAVLPKLSRLRIRDGLSPNDTPFTTPRTQWARDTNTPFGHEVEGEYLIMVGPKLFDGDVSQDDPSTLVHEMTHVWQYKHGTLSEWHAATAHVHYWLRDKVGLGPYDKLYEYQIGESWDDMGFEGQAQLVQDWYQDDKMSETSDRWIYFKNVVLMDNPRARPLSLGELRTWEMPVDGLDQPSQHWSREEVPFNDDYLRRVLEQPIGPNDVAKQAARVKTLEDYFRQLRRLKLTDAVALAARLKTPAPRDQLAQAFHYRLSTATTSRLLNILLGLA